MHKKTSPIVQNTHKQLTDDKKYTKTHLAKDMTFNLCAYNVEYLFTAMESIMSNHLHAAFNTIRPVYESIPKIFYIYHRPEDAFYILLQEQYNLKRTDIEYGRFKKGLKNGISVLEEFLSQARKSPLAGDCNMDAKYVNRKFNELTNKHYRKQVYTDEQLIMQNSTYAVLSSNSHANASRFDRFVIDNNENRSKFTKILADVAFFNFYLLANICHEELNQVGETKDTFDFLTGVNEEIGDLVQITNLYPQRPEYIKNLVIKPTWDVSDG